MKTVHSPVWTLSHCSQLWHEPAAPGLRRRRNWFDDDALAFKMKDTTASIHLTEADKRRNLVERAFCRLKDWRRVATLYDKLARNFHAAVAIAAIIIWWA